MKTERLIKQQKSNNKHSLFEWLQLLATLSVAVAIGIFTILSSYQQNALTKQNLEISIANRDTDLLIAEESRRKDIQMIEDQHRENTLIDYMKFLSDMLLQYGRTLNGTGEVSMLIEIKTLSALKQLDPFRKSLIFSALDKAELIREQSTFEEEYNGQPAPVNLDGADLSGMMFGEQLIRAPAFPKPLYERFRVFAANFTKSLFLNCQFQNWHSYHSTFDQTKWQSVNIEQSEFVFGSFQYVVLLNINFRLVFLSGSHFFMANMTEITFQDSNPFQTVFEASVLSNMIFSKSNFQDTEMKNVECSEVTIINSSFDRALFENSTFINLKVIKSSYKHLKSIKNSTFIESYWIQTNMSDIRRVETSNFSRSTFHQVDMSHGIFIDVDFSLTNFSKSVFNNSLFERVNFRSAFVTDEQLSSATSLIQCILPNGTLVSRTT